MFPADDTEERLADLFAAYLLMPKAAVSQGFKNRCFSPEHSDALQVYTVAQWLGVGYSTLCFHLRHSVRLISPDQFEALSKHRPKDIKHRILGFNSTGGVFIVDNSWYGRPVDVEVGDIIIVPPGTLVEGTGLRSIASNSPNLPFEATNVCIGRLIVPPNGHSLFYRVRRKNYVGISKFRHLEDISE